MGRYREPDATPYADVPEDWDDRRIIYIERPQKTDNRVAHTLDAVIIALILGLGAFMWNYTTSMESRMTKVETQIDNIHEAFNYRYRESNETRGAR